MKTRTHIKRLTLTALFTALIFLSTAFIKFPVTLGYVHVGDVFILLASFALPPVFSILSAGVGSALADLLAGYVIYAPVTFVVKGVMALIFSLFIYNKSNLARVLLSVLLGSIMMVVSYFIFEGIVYGWGLALSNIPLQLIQPLVTIILGTAIVLSLGKINFVVRLKTEIALKSHYKYPKEAKKVD